MATRIFFRDFRRLFLPENELPIRRFLFSLPPRPPAGLCPTSTRYSLARSFAVEFLIKSALAARVSAKESGAKIKDTKDPPRKYTRARVTRQRIKLARRAAQPRARAELFLADPSRFPSVSLGATSVYDAAFGPFFSSEETGRAPELAATRGRARRRYHPFAVLSHRLARTRRGTFNGANPGQVCERRRGLRMTEYPSHGRDNENRSLVHSLARGFQTALRRKYFSDIRDRHAPRHPFDQTPRERYSSDANALLRPFVRSFLLAFFPSSPLHALDTRSSEKFPRIALSWEGTLRRSARASSIKVRIARRETAAAVGHTRGQRRRRRGRRNPLVCPRQTAGESE